jgi:hypothetical protein
VMLEEEEIDTELEEDAVFTELVALLDCEEETELAEEEVTTDGIHKSWKLLAL